MEGQISTYKSAIQSNNQSAPTRDESGQWHHKVSPVVIEDKKALKELAKMDSTFILLRNEISGLKKDMRNMINANVITTQSTSVLQSDLRDSLVVINDTLKMLIQKFDKITPWQIQHGEIINGIVTTTTTTYDTIVVSAYVKKKWFLGKRKIEVEGVSKNPDTKVFIKSFLIR
ncbi:MAG: hypothetical protein NVV82_00145 [Sporocytophaga sp.]|nr:hypothetical protein [Sporocytophaga sp.]